MLPLTLVADATLSGRPTRLDYQSLDTQRHLLFIAHLGDSAVIVFDTQAHRVVATIPGVAAVHGLLAVPSLNTVYASATGTNELVAIDESTLKVRWRAAAGVYPDGIAYDPVNGHLFVSDEHGNTDTVIDATRGVRIDTISLGGEVGNTQYDPHSRHIFVNVEGRTQLVEIDPLARAIVRKMRLTGCDGNHGLLIDAPRRHAFIACENNATLLEIDLSTMHQLGKWSTGADPDVLAMDARANTLYVAAESGIVAMFRSGVTVTKIAQAFLAPEAHTVSVDPQTHLSYWPLQDMAGRAVLRTLELQE
ncbi:MAG: hypothetical protein M3Z37_05725 [Candidatus Eremiobacteraeota bacterium]|nr:hypothetical protein [Candidatus Eremiobacteraeota bacterium]